MSKLPAPPLSNKSETAWMYAILAVSFLVQANAVFHHGIYGQDFALHTDAVQKAVRDPMGWLFTPQDRTSPPLFHFLVSWVYRACSGIHWLEVTGLILAAVNLVSLRLFYATAKMLVASRPFRLGLLALVTFLPVTLVQTVVLAADSVSQLPFFVIMYALVGVCRGRLSPARGGWYAALACAFGFSTKFVAVSYLPAMLCAVLVLCQARVVPWRRGLVFLAVFLCLGSALEYYWLTQKKSNVTSSFSPAMGGYEKPPEKVNLRSLFFFRTGDAYLLNAPSYFLLLQNHPKAPQTLYDSNYFSFPGLAIYATLSDHMNIFQTKGPAPYGTRSSENERRMALAVKTGAALAVGIVAAAFLIFFWNGFRALVHRESGAAAITGIGLFALAWLAFIMTLLPLATVGALYGYWTPRLFIPTIWSFALLAFYGLGRLRPFNQGTQWGSWLVLVLVLFQSGLHISFLWPWHNY